MTPFRSLFPLVTWLLRITVGLFVYVTYFNIFKAFNFDTLNFWIATLLVIFSALLIIGGFVREHKITVISGLIIGIVTVYLMIVNFSSFLNPGFSIYLMLATIAFFFVSRGNKK